MFPQPAAADLNVSFELERPLQLEARLLDLSGKLVLTQALESNRGSLDVANLPAGNYLLNIADERGQVFSSKPVSIQH
ncbi:MAG: T9SS type A sorting domain-containing protein [Bacteroidia bacterium]|nr:T9SS type A sorting domain-containing protein [Bacteroidia bacterium]